LGEKTRLCRRQKWGRCLHLLFSHRVGLRFGLETSPCLQSPALVPLRVNFRPDFELTIELLAVRVPERVICLLQPMAFGARAE
jgi:hypothetical protein